MTVCLTPRFSNHATTQNTRARQVELNKDGQIEVVESPTELDQVVAQAFERAATEAANMASAASADLVDSPASESANTTGNNNSNEESTAEVSTN